MGFAGRTPNKYQSEYTTVDSMENFMLPDSDCDNTRPEFLAAMIEAAWERGFFSSGSSNSRSLADSATSEIRPTTL